MFEMSSFPCVSNQKLNTIRFNSNDGSGDDHAPKGLDPCDCRHRQPWELREGRGDHYPHMSTCRSVYLSVCLSVSLSLSVSLFLCLSVCTYVRMYVCTYVRMYVRMYVCTYVRTYVCMYVCISFLVYVLIPLIVRLFRYT